MALQSLKIGLLRPKLETNKRPQRTHRPKILHILFVFRSKHIH